MENSAQQSMIWNLSASMITVNITVTRKDRGAIIDIPIYGSFTTLSIEESKIPSYLMVPTSLQAAIPWDYNCTFKVFEMLTIVTYYNYYMIMIINRCIRYAITL